MAGSASVPNQFQTQNGPIPLSQLDNNFTSLLTPINTLANYSNYYVDSSGAANTMTIAVPGPQVVSYVAGLRLDVKLSNTNTSQTVNINVNGLGNQAVQNADGSQVAIGQLVAGQILSMIYNGTAFTLNGAQSSSSTSILPFTKTAAGNVTLPAPSSGVALTINGAAAAATASFQTAAGNTASLALLSAGGACESIFTTSITGVINAGFAVNNAGVTDAYGIPTGQGGIGTGSANPFAITTNATARLTALANGQIVIAAPSAGTPLTISGANSIGIAVNNSSGGTAFSGMTFGSAGSANLSGGITAQAISASSGQISLQYVVGSALTTGLTIDVSGNVNVPNGTGSLSPVYAGIPQNSQAANYTLVLSDANKTIYHSSGTAHTFTIPANASVAYPIGTAITFINTTGGGALSIACGDTLQLSPGGATGTRTLAQIGIATAVKILSNYWYISGTNLS